MSLMAALTCRPVRRGRAPLVLVRGFLGVGCALAMLLREALTY